MANDTDDDTAIAIFLRQSAEMKALHAEFISRVGELLEPYNTGAKSLMIAHGAAILACLQFFSERLEVSHQKAIAFLAGCFCLGFCAAVLATFFGAYAKQHALRRQWEPSISTGSWELGACLGFLAVSLLILLFSVGAIGIAMLKGEIGI